MKILLIDPCNFENHPIGGTLSFTKQLMGAFKNELILVGLSTDQQTPVGKWIKKKIGDEEYDFFAFRRAKVTSKKPVIPDRIKNFIAIKYHKNKIKSYSKSINNVFIQSPDTLLAIQNWGYKNICFRSPGVINMLIGSRFWYGKYLANISQRLVYKALTKVNIILASAEKAAINEFLQKSNRILENKKVIQFPTRVNTSLFRRLNKSACRLKLNIHDKNIIVVSTGRLGKYKGWQFMIDCFSEFKKDHPTSKFYLLGDGEDRHKIEEYIKISNLEKDVFISGSIHPSEIADYLNAADLYIMGSYVEGWSTSLMEAIACEKPVCVTDFGSAFDMVEDGINGYVISQHNQNDFIEKMSSCLKLNPDGLTNKSRYFSQFSLKNLRNDLLFHWDIAS